MSIFSKKTAAMLCVLASGFAGFSYAAETAQPAPQQVTTATTAAVAAQAPAAQGTSVNINSASAEELAGTLNGVGMVKAQAIVEFRTTNGPFMQLEEVAQVKGIGPSTLEKNKDKIRFE